MSKTQINCDFGSGSTVAEYVGTSAARAVAINAIDTHDALLMLDMLGLVPPQPGNEIINQAKATRKAKEASKKLKKEDERLARYGVTLEEIGEDES